MPLQTFHWDTDMKWSPVIKNPISTGAENVDSGAGLLWSAPCQLCDLEPETWEPGSEMSARCTVFLVVCSGGEPLWGNAGSWVRHSICDGSTVMVVSWGILPLGWYLVSWVKRAERTCLLYTPLVTHHFLWAASRDGVQPRARKASSQQLRNEFFSLKGDSVVLDSPPLNKEDNSNSFSVMPF